jgi:hypothetical protein
VKEMSVYSRSAVVLASLVTAMLVWASPGLPAASMGSYQAETHDFSISYVALQYGSNYPTPAYRTALEILSNGDYSVNYTTTSDPSEDWTGAGSISPELALAIFETILAEGFCYMLGSYRDLGHPENACEETLAVMCPSGDKSVSFGGFSMMGLMPESWTMLSNLLYSLWSERTEPLEVGLDISLTPGPRPTETGISLELTNGEDFVVSDAGVCETLWPVRVLRVNGCSVHTFGITSAPTCTMDFGPGTTTEFEAQTWNWSGVAAGFYVIMVMVVVSDYVLFEVPGSSGAANQRPAAEFSVDPSEGNRTTKFVFDATRSCDLEDNCSDLKVRWDWEGDGIWDTAWLGERVYSHTYAEDGKYYATMQVMDSDGLVNETSLRITVGETGDALYLIALGAMLAVMVAVAVALLIRRRRLTRP